jgi:response regulator RpfG family c-di-GMP phosphodiesterase
MSASKRYIPIVVEPDLRKQAYLHQAIRAEPEFKKSKGFRNVESSLKYLRSSESVDVVLISSEFTQYVINHFISAAKESRGGKEAAYVLCAPMDKDSREDVAASVIEGMDGVLFSPFSVHSVKEVARIAAQVKKKFELKRKKAALLLLLPNVTNAIDDLSKLMFEGSNISPAKKKLMSSIDSIAHLREDLMEDYYSALFSLCESGRPRPTNSMSLNYTGASTRLRKRLNKE